jgi:putative ABC transport system permease protein
LTNQFQELGLFSTMQVYPKIKSFKDDTTKVAPLDKAAVEKLATLRGVNLAYPYESFSVTTKYLDSTTTTKAQALSVAAIKTKLFSKILAGKSFESDTSREILVSAELLTPLGIASNDSAIGKSLIVSVRVATVDSGLVHIISDDKRSFRERLREINFDSLRYSAYLRGVVFKEANGAVSRFMNGFLNAREVIVDTLKICGVLQERHADRLRLGSIVFPIATANRFTESGFSGDPTELMAAINSGSLFKVEREKSNKNYPLVTLDLDPYVPYKTISDSVEALGFRTFSFAAQFDEIRRSFVYFDLALALIGLIALTTASLGIANTMIMSILERKREIGVLKSLGAEEQQIKFLFLAESGMIGTFGAVAGIIFGWLISRGSSAIAKMLMQKQGFPAIELFAIPLWLIGAALAIGIIVSLLAGFYPASRAARVDPVEALRGE